MKIFYHKNTERGNPVPDSSPDPVRSHVTVKDAIFFGVAHHSWYANLKNKDKNKDKDKLNYKEEHL